jgi:hypothetical protein
MKTYLLIIPIVFLIIFFSFVEVFGQNQEFSFEIYHNLVSPGCGVSLNCTRWPTVTNVNVSEPDAENNIIITAEAFDVSGVSLVKAIIESSEGVREEIPMQKLGSVYSTDPINVEDYLPDLYNIHIFAVDTLFNSNEYLNMGTLNLSGPETTVELWENYNKEAWGNWNSNSDDPYNVWYMDSRAQFIILASDLESVGLDSGSRIKSFFLETYQIPDRGLKDFRIRAKLTTATVSTSWEGGWTDFFGPTTILKDDIILEEWKEYSSENGFEWDGEKNIMVDISRNDDYYNQSGGMYRRTGLDQNKMFSGMCDDGWGGDCALYSLSGEETYGIPKNYVPALKIKYASN